MDNTTYITLSRQTALRRQMDILAHNLANASTTAFKAEAPLFSEYLARAGGQRELAFVQDKGSMRDTSEGPMHRTGNPLDLAIHGDAYFVIQTDRGERYTRNGHFLLDGEGNLVTSADNQVLDVDGREIQIPRDQTGITISSDGSISGVNGPIARLQLVEFANPQGLRREANSLYVTSDDPQEPREASVIQGMLEQSNVKPIVEMTNMINLHRSYQSNNKLVDTEDQLQRRTIDRIMRA
ncbi:MAG: flagellar basal-body rod protein FlgF [Alphaproteobacteria bacterium]|jgi:flagellar basal-body rod protein FlgF|nr:flagellar basal-body rod protein FlgF [Alphaproteobacteria bacterium]|tara:strand:- start:275 stop:991 length:717 start_codon:yes stop_codon:yes gene_type:complete